MPAETAVLSHPIHICSTAWLPAASCCVHTGAPAVVKAKPSLPCSSRPILSISSKTPLLYALSCSVNFPLSGARSHQHIQAAPESSSLKAGFLELTLLLATALLLCFCRGGNFQKELSRFTAFLPSPPSLCLPPSAGCWCQGLRGLSQPLSVPLLLPAQQQQCSGQSWSLAAPSRCPCRPLHQQCPSSRVAGLRAQPCLPTTLSVPLPGTALLGKAAVLALGSLLPLTPL